MNRNAAFINNDPLDFKDWMIGIGTSILIHVLVCAGFFFFSHSFSDTVKPLNAIDVDLAYLPPSKGRPDATGGDQGMDDPAPQPPVAEKQDAAPPLESEKAVETKKPVEPLKPAVKDDSAISLKKDKVPPKKTEDRKKEPNDEEMISKALKRIEKNVKAHHEEVNPLADRLRRLASEAAKGEGGPRGNGGTEEGEQTESGLNSALISMYKIKIGTQLKENWAFSPHLTGGKKNLETWVSFEVLPNGEIMDVTITKRSGNNYMDSAATMAVLKSSPMKPHPSGINKTSIKMGFKFKPNDVN